MKRRVRPCLVLIRQTDESLPWNSLGIEFDVDLDIFSVFDDIFGDEVSRLYALNGLFLSYHHSHRILDGGKF